MKIISVNKENFKNEVINSKIPVLVDFNASWCGPCRMLHPILEKISEETDDFKIVSINVDEEEELAAEYEISSIPCLLVFKDGKESNRNVGLVQKENIIEMMEN